MIIKSSVIKTAEDRQPEETKQGPFRQPSPAEESFALTAPPRISVPSTVLAKRAANLAFAGAKPSTTEMERLIGTNDLVDEFYLQRALVAARPVMRITLRDPAGRERGWATGFMVSPRLLLSNWHVFPTREETNNAIVEANYVLDIAGNPAPSIRFMVRGNQFYLTDQALDFALVAIDQLAQDGSSQLSQFGYHRLLGEPNKIQQGEAMTLVQHPGGERRQFSIRENQLVKLLDQFLWYQSDTAPGSSGAPAFNDSFQVVALHHSGAAQRDEAGRYVLKDGSHVDSLEGVEESKVNWVANEGLRISVLCDFLHANLNPGDPYASELLQAMQGGDVMEMALEAKTAPFNQGTATPEAFSLSKNTLNIPLQIQVSLSMGAMETAVFGASSQAPVGGGSQATLPPGVEALRFPIVDRDYTDRGGYQEDFLGVKAPLPVISDPTLVSQMADGSHAIPYEHFTIVVNKQRRLPLFTAANVDYTEAKRHPEAGDYTRKGLTGLGKNDQEKWLTDPRIPQQDQLPDVFYTKDGGSFDKGHVVRREDMCWGDTYELIQKANGDTFHVTNCTPQVAGFNRSALGTENWGDLENEIQKQSKAEKLCVFAGPILANSDKFFEGKDDFGPVKIQIPREFWKVVLAVEGEKLAAYAFILQQDLQNVPEEFMVTATWKPYLVSLDTLEGRLAGFTFAPEIHEADRAKSGGDELARSIGAEIHPSLAGDTPADPGPA
jgi:endonuclease G